MKIAIAQCTPALGAMKRNLEMHREWIAKARAADAKLNRNPPHVSASQGALMGGR